jgi:hypothetical protein
MILNKLGQFRVIVQIGAFVFSFFCEDLFGLGSLQLVSHPNFCFGAFLSTRTFSSEKFHIHVLMIIQEDL